MTRYDLIIQGISQERLDRLLEDDRLSYLDSYTLLSAQCESFDELIRLLAALRAMGIHIVGVDLRDGVSLGDRLLQQWDEEDP